MHHQVLRQIYGPINMKGFKYNAAIPLRDLHRLDKSNGNNRSEGAESMLKEIRNLRPGRYDFLDATTFDSNKAEFGNLPSERVSQEVTDGMVLRWRKDPADVDDVDEIGVADRSEDELLLRATDVLQS